MLMKFGMQAVFSALKIPALCACGVMGLFITCIVIAVALRRKPIDEQRQDDIDQTEYLMKYYSKHSGKDTKKA